MAYVCGIDFGSLQTPGYVAWLEDGEFVLDLYQPTLDEPLPLPPGGGSPIYTAIDAPQGLPWPGERMRLADREAGVPTRSLPVTREEMDRWPLYRELVRGGVEVFWALHTQERWSIAGLVPVPGAEGTVCETYPRRVFRQLFPDGALPPKRRRPVAYVDQVWDGLQSLGYTCPGVLRPTVDQADAMLCALAAEAFLLEDDLPAGTVGKPPVVDPAERVLREGFIVAPALRRV